MDFIDYEVCADCMMFIATDELPEAGGDEILTGINREIGDKKAHFCCGPSPYTYEARIDENGADYWDNYDGEGFSFSDCELCRDGLGGDRHLVCLVIGE